MRALAPLPPGSPQYEDRFVSPGGVTVAYTEDSGKQHVIEGDGLCPLLYQHLFKTTKSREHTLNTVRLPETVVFDHNFPRAWYTYDTENKAIAKRSSKMLDAQTMYEHFSRSSAVGVTHGKKSGGGGNGAEPARECDIVAQFFYATAPVSEEWKNVLTSRERAAGAYEGQLMTYVEFFTAATLHDFLFQQQRKPDGVLQKFVMPKGEGTSRRNLQLQVSWSPLITTVYKRTNRHRLDDIAVSLSTRASTYDGPRWLSEETVVADETKAQMTSLCEDIAAHFYSTEGKQITRLTLHFKVDDHNRMWLLWCSSVRVAADSLNPSFLRVPPAADMRTEVRNEGNTTVARVEGRRLRQKQLLALDNELYQVTKDLGFALTANASHKRQAKALDMKGMAADEDGARDTAAHRHSPAYNPQHPLYPSFQRVWGPQDVEAMALAPSGSVRPDFSSPTRQRTASSAAASLAGDASGSGSGPRGSAATAAAAQSAVREELAALAMDAWYAVYSTTLADDPHVMPTRVVALAAPLLGVLQEEELQLLTYDILGLQRVRRGSKEASATAARGQDDLVGVYHVPPHLVSSGRRLDRPSTQVEKEVQDFFTDLFAYRGPEVAQACLEKHPLYFEDI